MTDRLIVLVVALAVAAVLGFVGRWRERRSERRGFEQVNVDRPMTPSGLPGLSPLPQGANGAVVVLGTRACVTCARTHALLEREAAATGGTVVARHLLVEDHPDLVSRLDVRTAPTVVVVDAAGMVIARHDGGLDLAGAQRAVAALSGQGVGGARS